MGSFSLFHWLIVLLVVIMMFGTKKIRNIGQDLGGAVRGFKEGLHGEDAKGNSIANGAEQAPQKAAESTSR